MDLHMDLFWSADGQCLGEASDTPMTSGLGGPDDDDSVGAFVNKCKSR